MNSAKMFQKIIFMITVASHCLRNLSLVLRHTNNASGAPLRHCADHRELGNLTISQTKLNFILHYWHFAINLQTRNNFPHMMFGNDGKH